MEVKITSGCGRTLTLFKEDGKFYWNINPAILRSEVLVNKRKRVLLGHYRDINGNNSIMKFAKKDLKGVTFEISSS